MGNKKSKELRDDSLKLPEPEISVQKPIFKEKEREKEEEISIDEDTVGSEEEMDDEKSFKTHDLIKTNDLQQNKKIEEKFNFNQAAYIGPFETTNRHKGLITFYFIFSSFNFFFFFFFILKFFLTNKNSLVSTSYGSIYLKKKLSIGKIYYYEVF